VTFELAIRGGTVVGATGRRRLDVLIDGGRIAALEPPGEAVEAAETLDARGLLVLPGMVDTHVHFMDPGDSTREDFPTGTAAAALRGVTTVVEHTHGWPVISADRLAEKRAHLRGRSHVDFGLAAHVWPDRIDDLPALWQAGVAFFKAFTCHTHGIPAIDADRLLDLAQALGAIDATCLVHCEDDLMTAANERRLRHAMRTDGGVIPEWRSREAELLAVGTVAAAARATGSRFVIAHASSAEVVDVVAQERAAGSPLVAESCPQYLHLREDEVVTEGALRKFTPPARIRSDQDEAAMWEAFARGRVHHLSSDHAPATLEQKRAGTIWEVHFGLPGIDTTSSLLLDAALRGRVSIERVVEAYATAPARLYGLAGKGRLEEGADADVVLVDPEPESELSDAAVVSRAGWTPYAGRRVRGRVVTTLLRGRRLVEDGELVPGPAEGRFVPGPGAER
jgi:allantoinase